MGRVSKESKASFGPAWDTFHIQERPYFETTGFYHSENTLDEWFKILVYFEKRLFAAASTPACSSQRQQTDSLPVRYGAATYLLLSKLKDCSGG